jgi:hypothetical protein
MVRPGRWFSPKVRRIFRRKLRGAASCRQLQAAGRKPQASGRRTQAAGRRPQDAGRRPQASPDSRLRTPEISSDRTMTDDDEQISTASDGHSGGDDNDDEVVVMSALPVAPVARSSRKRAKRDFPWSYTRVWAEGDAPRECGKRQCNSCKGWYSANTNASG